MKLLKLEHKFYRENTHLKEALDNHNGNWEKGKIRGYGIVIIDLNTLKFAIPLRSNINHDACFIISKQKNQNSTVITGLDFSKALLIKNPSYISKEIFRIPNEQHNRLKVKEHFIAQKFSKYVEKYTKAILKTDKRILNLPEYRFSTLQNYHLELTKT